MQDKIQDKIPTDENGILHGQCETYFSNNNLKFKGYLIHGKNFGLRRWNNLNINEYHAR